ncbi:oxidation resistance protein 1-like [Phodopus roborovskii]|uniref:oxidation resistance protein 1-like n=1 Tax=Phodopus roborovskii TaxID=109678 RepID=UPI0021E4ECBE|nr:oxidation resistance protein 1-like [Phodopus roborovskii]
MSVSNLSWLKKKSQSVDITAPGFNPLGGTGKQVPQTSRAPAPKTPIIEEEQNNSANAQKHPPKKTELKRFYTIGLGGDGQGYLSLNYSSDFCWEV